jgi:hypothetical protein
MKLTLVEYPFGKRKGFDVDKIYFIIAINDQGTYMFERWTDSPCAYLCGRVNSVEEAINDTEWNDLAYTDYAECDKDFQRIKQWFENQKKENIIKTLKEIEV